MFAQPAAKLSPEDNSSVLFVVPVLSLSPTRIPVLEKEKRKKAKIGIIILVVVLVALLAVVGIIGDKVYESYFGGFLNKKEDITAQSINEIESDEEAPTIEGTIENESITEKAEATSEIITSVVATTETITTTEPETTAGDLINAVPEELRIYANGLVYEGKTYAISLQEDDWYINIHSSPVLIDIDAANTNVVGKMKSGTKIYVEYIYNGTWAVFYQDGRYVFSSLYASNDPSKNELMKVVE